ncbi:MAG: hypothetical protein AB2814_03905 [Candidatus Sedimenticola endophacoides]
MPNTEQETAQEQIRLCQEKVERFRQPASAHEALILRYYRQRLRTLLRAWEDGGSVRAPEGAG